VKNSSLVFSDHLSRGAPRRRLTRRRREPASAALDKAFEWQSAEAIKSLTTPDHVADYGHPRAVEEQIATLSELKYEQTKIGDD
jgi:hypothetical protein